MNNPSLLRVFPGSTQKGSPVHLSLEVNPLTAPYLVTSSKGVVWLDKPRPDGTVWSVFRFVSPGDLFRELVSSIVSRSDEEGWGCVFGVSEIHQAISRLREYDLDDTEMLVSPTFYVGASDIPTVLASWLPEGYAIVVPSNRDFLGVVIDLADQGIAALVHNPSRGISILVPRDEELVG